MSEPAGAGIDAVDPFLIRTRPPQPKRLSRKVLVSVALALGSVVATALIFGLSENVRQASDRPAPAPASMPATPEALRSLPSAYDAYGLELSPPAGADMLWGEAGPPPHARDDEEAEQQGADRGSRPVEAGAEFDPSAPIFYARERSRAGADARASAGAAGQAAYAPPASPYVIQAGSIISAALVTGLNSDLPGRVIAQVTTPVFDSVTGRHVLAPQGARLIGSYEARGGYGQRRLFVSWERIIMPNGWSLDLAQMEAADAAGAAGLSDRVDNHLGRLAGAVFLSALMSVVANEAEDDDPDHGFGRSVGDAAAQQAASSGARIVDRELDVRPTLRVRPGAPVRVLVTRDLVLAPYGE